MPGVVQEITRLLASPVLNFAVVLRLDLPAKQVGNQLASGDTGCVVECQKVQCGEEGICEAEGKHQGDPA